MRALARALDRSPSTILKWLRHPDWVFFRKPPWPTDQLPEMLRWAEKNLRPAPDADFDDESWKLKLLSEKARLQILSLIAEYDLKPIPANILIARLREIIADWRINESEESTVHRVVAADSSPAGGGPHAAGLSNQTPADAGELSQ